MVNPLASRFNCDAALVDPRSSARVESYLATAWDALRTETSKRDLAIEMSASDDEDGFWSEDWSWLRPYNVVDGVLQIPVKGVLLSGFPYQLWDWATGYEYIMAAYQRGMDDPNVKGLAFVIDSPGGEVEGNFDLVDFMSGDAKVKPVQAFAVAAYSAAYSIASAADKITVTRTGGVGSIGVVTSHVDMSKALDDWGYKITFIFAGKHKVDGNPYEPLPDDVKARIQTTVDKLGQYVRQVVNDSRQNKPSIKVRPVDSGADPEVADVMQGVVRHIEDNSRADIAYDSSIEFAVRAGFGYIRVVTDYADEDSFDVDAFIKTVRNPFSTYLDKDAQELDGSDARYGFFFDDMPRESFEAEHPGADGAD